MAPMDDEKRAEIREGIGKIMSKPQQIFRPGKAKRITAERAEELARRAEEEKGKATVAAAETVNPPTAGIQGDVSATPPQVAAPTVAEPVAAPVVIGSRKWRVVASKRVRLCGQNILLPVGKVIGEDSHGSEAIASLRKQGVEFEEVK